MMVPLSTVTLIAISIVVLLAVLLALFRPRHVSLLAAAIALATLGVLGVETPGPAASRVRVVLIDASASVANEHREILARPEALLEGLTDDDSFALATFSRFPRALGAGSVSHLRRWGLLGDVGVAGTGTDIETALRAYAALAREAERLEVHLATDGRETRGSAAAAIRELRDLGAEITVREMGRRAAADVRVVAVEAPPSARSDDDLRILVLVSGPPGSETIVRLDRGAAEIGSRRVVLGPEGRARVGFEDRVDVDPGWARYRATIAPGAGVDPIPANDRRAALVRIEGPPTVLAFAGTDGLVSHLRERGFPVVVANASDPGLVRTLRETPPGLILLEDRPAHGVPVEVLESVSAGTGLLVVGGIDAFGPGGYAGSRLEAALPLRSRREDDAGLAVVLLVDVSGSMNEPFGDATGGTRKRTAARRAAAALVRALPPGARVALVPFAAETRGSTPLLSPDVPAEAEALSTILQKLDDTDLVRGETDLVFPLSAAARLLAEDSGRRHVVLVSDGEVAPSRRDEILAARQRLLATGATLGVVATATRPEGLGILRDLAGAEPRRAGDGETLVRAFLEELRAAAGSGLLETGPAPVRGTAALDDFDAPENLVLDAWLRTWVRPGGRVVLQTAGEEPWPVLALGRFGLGATAAVPTTPGRQAPIAWGTADGGSLWASLVRRLARPEAPTGIGLSSALGPRGEVVVTLSALDPEGRFLDLDRPRLADGTPLLRVAPGRYEVALEPAPGDGAIGVRILVGEGDGRLLLSRPVARPLESELTAAGPDRPALAALREAAAGAGIEPRGSRDTSWVPLLLAAILVVGSAVTGLRRRRDA